MYIDMTDTTLATFRVDKETWKEFKRWASKRGSNASTELNQFILKSLGRIDRNLDKRDNRIDKDIDKCIDKYLDKNLDERIEETVKRYLDKHIDEYIDTKSDERIDINIDKNIDNDINKDPTTLDEETTVTESVGEEEVIEPLPDEKGLLGKELASLLGVRPEYLTRWKNGKNIPKEDSENYQAYQNFCNYRWEKKKGTNQAKYYRVVHSQN